MESLSAHSPAASKDTVSALQRLEIVTQFLLCKQRLGIALQSLLASSLYMISNVCQQQKVRQIKVAGLSSCEFCVENRERDF